MSTWPSSSAGRSGDRPVPDLAPGREGAHEADDVAGHLAVRDHGPGEDGLVSENPVLPMAHERVPIPGAEPGHPGGLRVPLMLEEDRQVGVDHVSALDAAPRRPRTRAVRTRATPEARAGPDGRTRLPRWGAGASANGRCRRPRMPPRPRAPGTG